MALFTLEDFCHLCVFQRQRPIREKLDWFQRVSFVKLNLDRHQTNLVFGFDQRLFVITSLRLELLT